MVLKVVRLTFQAQHHAQEAQVTLIVKPQKKLATTPVTNALTHAQVVGLQVHARQERLVKKSLYRVTAAENVTAMHNARKATHTQMKQLAKRAVTFVQKALRVQDVGREAMQLDVLTDTPKA